MQYTVEIQASNADGTIWQALAPAETVDGADSAGDAAMMVGFNQNITEGSNWRIAVWDGADADTGTTPVLVVPYEAGNEVG